MMTNTHSILFGNSTAQFNGRIRNTFPAVENVGLQNRAGGTRLNAARADPTTVCDSAIERPFEIGDDTTKEQPRPGLLIDDARVLSEPPNARIFRVHAFEQRPRIHVTFGVPAGILLNPPGQ